MSFKIKLTNDNYLRRMNKIQIVTGLCFITLNTITPWNIKYKVNTRSLIHFHHRT